MDEVSGLIDLHHHVVPKEYVKRLSELGVSKALGVPFPKWDAAKSIDVMDRYGIAASVASISAPGVYFGRQDRALAVAQELSRQTNEFCAQLVHDHPGRFGAFATLPLPDVEAALDELRYARDVLKLDGVVLLSNYDGYYLGDARFDPLFRELDRTKAIVFVHPATPPGLEASHLGFPEAFLEVCFDTTRTAFSLIVNGVTRRCPNVRFVLAHAGGAVPYMAARAGALTSLYESAGSFVHFIVAGAGLVSSVVPKKSGGAPGNLDFYARVQKNMPEGPEFYLRRFYYDTAVSASPHAFASLQTLVDSKQIVLGTDYVFAPEAAVPLTIRGVRDYKGFDAEDLLAVEKGNAMGLFPRFAK